MSRANLLAKSAQLDARVMGMAGRPIGWRSTFLARKYLALAMLSRGPYQFHMPSLSLTVRDLSGLGTMQSSIVDFYDDIAGPKILGSHPVIIDVGSNIGQFVNAAKLFYPEASVVCFEPDPTTFADLVVNTGDLSRVELHNVGLGAADETRAFYRHRLSLMSSFSPNAGELDRRGTSELRLRRLDDVIGSDMCPDLLKIDVEGFERQVLAGGWETVRRSRFLLLELSLGRAGGADNLELLREIAEHVPGATIVRFGRPLGKSRQPSCQDVLIDVGVREQPSDGPAPGGS